MTTITELKRDDLEIAARLYASSRAKDITPTIVDAVLTRTGRPDNSIRVEAAEEYVQELLATFVKLSVVEFTQKWTKELERRGEAMLKATAEILARTPNTMLLHRAGTPLHGEFVIKDVCPGCSHAHLYGTHCGVSMGGAGECDCKAEVRV